MVKCWSFKPDQRPSFKELVEILEKIMHSKGNYLDMTQSTFNNATYLQPISNSLGSIESTSESKCDEKRVVGTKVSSCTK